MHKLLVFKSIKHAFESGKSTNWPRILTRWVSRNCGRVIAESCCADADEDVGAPSGNFSPCLGGSVRGFRRGDPQQLHKQSLRQTQER